MCGHLNLKEIPLNHKQVVNFRCGSVWARVNHQACVKGEPVRESFVEINV